MRWDVGWGTLGFRVGRRGLSVHLEPTSLPVEGGKCPSWTRVLFPLACSSGKPHHHPEPRFSLVRWEQQSHLGCTVINRARGSGA